MPLHETTSQPTKNWTLWKVLLSKKTKIITNEVQPSLLQSWVISRCVLRRITVTLTSLDPARINARPHKSQVRHHPTSTLSSYKRSTLVIDAANAQSPADQKPPVHGEKRNVRAGHRCAMDLNLNLVGASDSYWRRTALKMLFDALFFFSTHDSSLLSFQRAFQHQLNYRFVGSGIMVAPSAMSLSSHGMLLTCDGTALDGTSTGPQRIQLYC